MRAFGLFVAVLLGLAHSAAAQYSVLNSGSSTGVPASGGTYSGLVTFGAGLNVTGGTLEQNGTTVVNQFSVSQGSLVAGYHAGLALPSGAIYSTFIGWAAGASFTGATGEATCVGTIACTLLDTGEFDTAIGEHAMGFETTGSDDTALGNDAQRDPSGTTGNTLVGKNAGYDYWGSTSTAVGFGALQGNAAAVILGGTVTTGDQIKLTFTSTGLVTSPFTVAYTVLNTDTLATAMAGLALACTQGVVDANLTSIKPSNGANGQLLTAFGIAWTSTSTLGPTPLTVTGAVTGAETETITITGGMSASVVDNIAIGSQALFGTLLTTGSQNVAIGKNTLMPLTSGSFNVAVGIFAGAGQTTASNTTVVGYAAGQSNVSTQGLTAFGYAALQSSTTSGGTAFGQWAGQNVTTGTNPVLIGNGAGRFLTTGPNNVGVGTNAIAGAASSTAGFDIGVGNFTLQNVTTASGDVAAGHNTGNKITTGSYNLLLGNNVAPTTLTTGSNNIMLCTGQTTCDATAAGTSNTAVFQGNNASPFWLVTGTNTPSTSVSAIAGAISVAGNVAYTGAAPVVSACGTSPAIDAHASNNSGTVTVGTVAAASCTVTFATSGYTTWDHCRVTPETSLATFSYSYTKTVLTVTATSLIGEVFDYDCDGQ